MNVFQRSYRRISSSFSNTLFMVGMVTIVFSIACAGALSYIYQSHQIRVNIEENHRDLLDSLTKSVAPALWNLADNSLIAIIDSTILTESLVGIEVHDIGTDAYTARWKLENGDIFNGPIEAETPLRYRVDLDDSAYIVYNDRPIGTLRLVSSYAAGLERIASTAFTLFIAQFLILSIVLSVLILVSRKAAHKISILDEAMEAYSAGNKSVRAEVPGTNEFSRLASRFNTMADVIRVYTEEMEAIVEERSRQLIESEKLAALGSLVAGVAHEINTPLGNSLTAASWIEDRNKDVIRQRDEGGLSPSDLVEFQERLDEAAKILMVSLKRTADLIVAFKNVGVDQMSDSKRRIALYDQLSDIVTSLRPALKQSNCSLIVECEKGIEIEINSGFLFQIVTNLVVNAANHAYGPEGGEIRIAVRPDRSTTKIYLTISDRGKGIEDDVRDKIFQPFYSTNRTNGGTGLGLTIVYNIVSRIGGTIDVETATGQGTSFLVSLPVIVF